MRARAGGSRRPAPRRSLVAAGPAVAVALLLVAAPAGAVPVDPHGVTAALQASPPVFAPRGGTATLTTSGGAATSCAITTVPPFAAGTRQ